MQNSYKYLAVIAFILFFVAISFWINMPSSSKNGLKTKETLDNIQRHKYEEIKSTEFLKSTIFLEKYIEDIINNGSYQNLGFSYGDMEGGFADEKAAPKIVAYIVSLSGRKPTHPEWIKEGRTFYVSNCGGCHGEDGKGLNGSFPDLTRDPFLGIEKRIERGFEAQASQ